MAFSTIASAAIAVGAAIKKELWDKVKNSFDDHEARINTLETVATKVPVIKWYVLNGSSFSTATGLHYYESDIDFTITSAFIRIFEKGTLTGSFEVDIKKSTTNLNGASFVSIFTTKPKITMSGASDYDASTNQVFDAGQIDIAVGDFLRFDITQAPTSGVMSKFLLTVYGE